jgi:Ca-activated chloride channel family protein
LVTDGEDTASHYKRRDIDRLLKETDVLMYSIRFNLTGIDFPVEEKSPILSEWASITGGKAYFTQSRVLRDRDRIYTQAQRDRSVMAAAFVEINYFIEQITSELRNQYAIGFRPTSSTNKDKWHQIKIKVTSPPGFPGIEGRSRKGYFGK